MCFAFFFLIVNRVLNFLTPLAEYDAMYATRAGDYSCSPRHRPTGDN